jgi:Na+/proline symporter
LETKDGEIDYSNNSLSELRDVESNIDAGRNPKNYANLQRAIQERVFEHESKATVAIYTNDIYRKFLRPDASEQALVRVARTATLVLGALSIGMAYLVPNVLELILYAYTFGAAGLFFPMLGLLFWPGTTASGAFWSMLGGGCSAVLWVLLDEPFGVSSSYLGWFVSLQLMVIVSLATDHSAEENLDMFYPTTIAATRRGE